MNLPKTVAQEWLAKEKEFTRQRDALSDARRTLPRVKIEKDYMFDYVDLVPKGRDEAELIHGSWLEKNVRCHAA